MNREQAKDTIRRSWRQLITGMTDTARQNVNGEKSYICPLCYHGEHGDGLTHNPQSKDGHGLKCFGCGFSGDIIDLYMAYNSCDYNAALSSLAAEMGITIDARQPAAVDFDDDATERPQSDFNSEKVNQYSAGGKNAHSVDFTAYYMACAGRLDDPAAISYLQARGISIDTARRFSVGFDPAADPASAPGALADEYKPHPAPRIIVPCSPSFYIARSIDPNTPAAFKAPNPKGTHTQLFNADAATLQKSFIIVPDDDALKQAEELNNALRAMNLQSIIYNVAGEHHDANDALKASRADFEAAIEATIAEIQQPAEKVVFVCEGWADALSILEAGYQAIATNGKGNGRLLLEHLQSLPAGLFTYESAVAAFEESNDQYLELPKFQQFSDLAKIKLHDSVVLAADTGGGKSSLAINFIDNLNDEYPVMYFNLEMDEITILRRLVSIRTGIELDRIEGYKNDARTAAAVNSALKIIDGRKPLQIIQDIYNLKAIEQQIQKSIAGREDPTIVVIDHSLLIKTGNNVSRYERFTEISEELRRISRQNNVILFVLLQQNREGKADENKRPTNSSLKESGSWENDATHILFLWYDPQTRQKKLIMTKNRGGSVGTFNLDYSAATQFYQEAASQPDNSPGRRQHKPTKREKEKQQLQEWYEQAYIDTFGDVTWEAIAEAGGTTTAVVKRRINEYGGYTIDGVKYEAAGRGVRVEENADGFIRMTPGEAPPFDDDIPTM